MRGVALVAWPSEALVAPCAERPMPIHLHRDLESISRQIIEVRQYQFEQPQQRGNAAQGSGFSHHGNGSQFVFLHDMNHFR